jgi:hypothetical protein
MTPLLILLRNPDCLLLNMINPQPMLLFLITIICFPFKMNRSHIKFSGQLALSNFPPNFHWIPEHPLNLAYYNNILIQTKYVHFKPIYCKTSKPPRLFFHNVYFHKIISEKDWGDHPSSPRVLANFDIPYCYYDYVEAWSKFMLYQTPKFDHSWFINFDKEFGGILPF